MTEDGSSVFANVNRLLLWIPSNSPAPPNLQVGGPILALEGIAYNDVFKISQANPDIEPKEIYLAKRLGLIAFVKNDSLWIRE